jgi:hypothetical protein
VLKQQSSIEISNAIFYPTDNRIDEIPPNTVSRIAEICPTSYLHGLLQASDNPGNGCFWMLESLEEVIWLASPSQSPTLLASRTAQIVHVCSNKIHRYASSIICLEANMLVLSIVKVLSMTTTPLCSDISHTPRRMCDLLQTFRRRIISGWVLQMLLCPLRHRWNSFLSTNFIAIIGFFI